MPKTKSRHNGSKDTYDTRLAAAQSLTSGDRVRHKVNGRWGIFLEINLGFALPEVWVQFSSDNECSVPVSCNPLDLELVNSTSYDSEELPSYSAEPEPRVTIEQPSTAVSLGELTKEEVAEGNFDGKSQCINLDVGDRVTHRSKPGIEGTVIELDFRRLRPQVLVQWDNTTGKEFNPPLLSSPDELVKVQAADVQIVAFEVAPPLMSFEEAQDCLNQIASHLRSIRALLLDLDERRGWQALGYKSMRQCLLTEFKQKKSHLRQLYRELEAGKVEKKLCPMGHKIGDIPERQLREIAKLPPEQWTLAWSEAIATAPHSGVTASHIANVVKLLKELPLESSQELPAPVTSGLHQQATEELEESFFKRSDLVLIDCPKSLGKEYTRWNGYWGMVTHVGCSGSIEVVVAGKKIRFMKSDLDPIDNPVPILKDIAHKINDLYNSPNLDEVDKHTLELYLKRLTFTDIQLDRLSHIWSYYFNRRLVQPSSDDE